MFGMGQVIDLLHRVRHADAEVNHLGQLYLEGRTRLGATALCITATPGWPTLRRWISAVARDAAAWGV